MVIEGDVSCRNSGWCWLRWGLGFGFEGMIITMGLVSVGSGVIGGRVGDSDLKEGEKGRMMMMVASGIIKSVPVRG